MVHKCFESFNAFAGGFHTFTVKVSTFRLVKGLKARARILLTGIMLPFQSLEPGEGKREEGKKGW